MDELQALLAALDARHADFIGTPHQGVANSARLAVSAARTAAVEAARTARLAGQAAVEASEANALAARLEREGSPLAESARRALREAVQALEPAARAAEQAAREVARLTEIAYARTQDLIAQAGGSFFPPAVRDFYLGAFAVARVALSETVAATTRAVSHGAAWLLRGTGLILGDAIGASSLGELFEILAGADIILPVGDSLSQAGAVRSRNVPSHEYGHFVLCNLLERADPVKFRLAYNEAAADGVLGQEPHKEHVVFNEAFADFITGQLAGAANYWSPHSSLQTAYCPAATTDSCWEDNVGGVGQKWSPDPREPFSTPVAVTSSLIHDAFDGHTRNPSAWQPSNGNPWQKVGEKLLFESRVKSLEPDINGLLHGSHADDEAVSLPGTALYPWIRRTLQRGTFLRYANVFGALSDIMHAHGSNWCQRCEVFRLHSNPPSCPEAWVGPRPRDVTCSWEPRVRPCVLLQDERFCDHCRANGGPIFCLYDWTSEDCNCPIY